MISRLNYYLQNKALFGTVIVTLGIFISSVFAYLLQLLLGRFLTLSEFGEFSALLSLSYIFAIPIGSLTTSIIKLSSELLGKHAYTSLTRLFWRLLFFSAIAGFLTFIVLFLLSPFISDYFKIGSNLSLISFSVFLGLSFLLVPSLSYLQGLLRFKAYAFTMVLGSFLRLVLPVLFSLTFLKVAGVYVGMSLGVVIMLGVSIALLRKNFVTGDFPDLKPYYKKLLTFSVHATFVNLSMTVLNNVDVVMVKHFFDPNSAGIYSALVTVGKILLFGAGTVSVVMLPQISELYSKGEDYQSRFKYFFIIQLFVVICGVLVFALFPQLVIKVMFGEKFLPSAELLPLFSVFIGIYVLIGFMNSYFLALNKTSFYYYLLPMVMFQALLINFYHQSLYAIVTINLVVSVLISLMTLGYYLKNAKIS